MYLEVSVIWYYITLIECDIGLSNNTMQIVNITVL